jgi:uncharacterized protein YacL
MMLACLLFFVLTCGMGAAIAARYQFIPSLGGVPGVVANLIGGTLVGGIFAGFLFLLWRIFRLELENEGTEIRIINGFIIGFVATLVGLILNFSLDLIFSTGAGLRIAQGLVLFGSFFLGLRVGYAFERPILPFGRTSLKMIRHMRKKRSAPSKVLDTSVIIDGRVGDLLRTGFLEGEILIPEFVLSELQNIADSSNSLRRRKGRRGLEILRELMQDDSVETRVFSRDYPAIREVDRKLIRLAKEESGVLITTDYNLNRVAQVEGVKILNINELANAVKPRFIPGEEISVQVIDRGEEIGQGIGYLDDGTMVVVENGRRHIGRTIKATVKSTLQTEAGRMLFVEPVGETSRWDR